MMKMLCEKCQKNQSTVFYQETVNGKTKSYSICAACAEEMEKKGEIKLETSHVFSDPFGDWFSDGLFGSLFTSRHGRGQALPQTKRCNLCGSSFQDFAASGKAGCPKCYEVFSAELEDSIRRIHGSIGHVGRVPKKRRANAERKKKLEEMAE
jgi:protein arginine kinase activator